MENKQLNQHRKALIGIIRKWKLNQPVMAAQMKMPAGTFKNKMLETAGKYAFTDQEFLELANVVDRLLGDLKGFCDQLDSKTDYLI